MMHMVMIIVMIYSSLQKNQTSLSLSLLELLFRVATSIVEHLSFIRFHLSFTHSSSIVDRRSSHRFFGCLRKLQVYAGRIEYVHNIKQAANINNSILIMSAEMEARHKKELKWLDQEKRAALKKIKGTAGKGKKAKEQIAV